VGRELISMGMGMRGVFWRERRFFQRLVGRMRQGMVKRVVPGVLQLTLTVLARPGPGDNSLPGFFGGWLLPG
jgi:hypothetical protein